MKEMETIKNLKARVRRNGTAGVLLKILVALAAFYLLLALAFQAVESLESRQALNRAAADQHRALDRAEEILKNTYQLYGGDLDFLIHSRPLMELADRGDEILPETAETMLNNYRRHRRSIRGVTLTAADGKVLYRQVDSPALEKLWPAGGITGRQYLGWWPRVLTDGDESQVTLMVTAPLLDSGDSVQGHLSLIADAGPVPGLGSGLEDPENPVKYLTRDNRFLHTGLSLNEVYPELSRMDLQEPGGVVQRGGWMISFREALLPEPFQTTESLTLLVSGDEVPAIRAGELLILDGMKLLFYVVGALFLTVLILNGEMIRRDRRRSDVATLIAESARDAVIITDPQTNITYANDMFYQITGFRPEEVLGEKPSRFKSGRHDREFYDDMWRSLEETGAWHGEVWDKKKNGVLYLKDLTILTQRDPRSGKVRNYVGVFNDLTAQWEMKKDLEILRNYDETTVLPKQRLFEDLLADNLAEDPSYLAVLNLKITNLDILTARYEEKLGNRIVGVFAEMLTALAGGNDVVARFSRDEFVLLVKGGARSDTERLLEKIRENLILEARQTRLVFKIAVGVAIYPQHGTTPQELLRHAGLAKEYAGRNENFSRVTYEPLIREELLKKMELEDLLENALARQEMELYFQAQVNSHSGNITGAESLLRWNSGRYGFIPPDQFIPLAEESGQIRSIGSWVLEEAVRHLALWEPLLPHDFRLSVNLSSQQLTDPNFTGNLFRILREYGVSPRRLELELTETVMVNEKDYINEEFSRLRREGISVAIDDFGTGFSSLSYLRGLKLDKLKIDRSFIRDVPDKDDGSIAALIVDIGKTLGLSIVAEGVETRDQVLFLNRVGCEVIQGYFYARPVPGDQFENTWLKKED